MKKSEIYRYAIESIVQDDCMEIGAKTDVLRELFTQLDRAELMEVPDGDRDEN